MFEEAVSSRTQAPGMLPAHAVASLLLNQCLCMGATRAQRTQV